MKNTVLLTLIISAVIGGITGALTGSIVALSSQVAPAPVMADALSGILGSDGSANDGEFQQLRVENQELRNRVAALESRSLSDLRVPAVAGVTMEDLKALEERLSSSKAKMQGFPADNANLKQGVEQALSVIRLKERTAAKIKAAEKQDVRREERLGRLSSKLGLDKNQVGQMREILTRKDQLDRELTAIWESGEGRETVGELKRTNHEEYQGSLQRVLTPEQLQLFQESNGRGKR